jgi:RNA polymerase sigma factor (TIGR02999 family)
MTSHPDASDVTALLLRWRDGDAPDREQLIDLVYEELRRVAGAQLRGERGDHTLQPTALVNEAYMRIVDQTRVQWQNRAHFFAVASRLMRRILVDHARRRTAAKRGGGVAPVRIESADPGVEGPDVDLVALDAAMERLSEQDERMTKVVELRYFAGLSVVETAEALGVSPATVKREWTTARAWLHRELRPAENS